MNLTPLSSHSVDEVVIDAVRKRNLIIGFCHHLQRLLVVLFTCKGQPDNGNTVIE